MAHDPANMKITEAMLNDPNFMIPFMRAIASGEAPGGHKVLSGAQWREAYEMYQQGGAGGLKQTTSALGSRAGTGGANNTLNMSSPITINGVAQGKEYAVARSVRSAIRDPIRQGLDELKKMREYEVRVTYV